MAWVYILECRDGSYYVGSTVDLERRLWEHQEGNGAEYTRHRRPVRLVWSASCERIDEAYAYEKQIQGWSRQKRQALMDGRMQDLGWLSSRSHASRRRRGGS
jgi:putative endonuclease